MEQYTWRRKHFVRHLYSIDRVASKAAELKQWQQQRDERQAKADTAQARRVARFARKYSSWTAALPDACKFLFDLNRYAKHDSCTGPHRDEIYGLKGDLVELLYKHGYCTDCYLHTTELPAKECWTCDGDGYHWSGEECRKCGGTGIYLPPKTLVFVCFRFAVGGIAYCWHQPKETVLFEFRVPSEESTFVLTEEEKPVSLALGNFAEAKDLLRWIIEQAHQEPVEVAA